MASWTRQMPNSPEAEEIPVFLAMIKMAGQIKQPPDILEGCAEILNSKRRS